MRRNIYTIVLHFLDDISECMDSFQFSSVTQSCPTLCDPMNRGTPGLPVHHQLPESTQTHEGTPPRPLGLKRREKKCLGAGTGFARAGAAMTDRSAGAESFRRRGCHSLPGSGSPSGMRCTPAPAGQAAQGYGGRFSLHPPRPQGVAPRGSAKHSGRPKWVGPGKQSP